MSNSDIKRLVNRARRAGLTTEQMYSSMNTRRPEAGEVNDSQGDSNGFISRYDKQGRRVFEPLPQCDGDSTKGKS